MNFNLYKTDTVLEVAATEFDGKNLQISLCVFMDGMGKGMAMGVAGRLQRESCESMRLHQKQSAKYHQSVRVWIAFQSWKVLQNIINTDFFSA